MTIEIDDAGTGDIVGDAFIGLLRKETGDIVFKTLPIELFQSDNWKIKLPYKKTLELVKEGLNELNFKRNEEKIKICRGNIFDEVRVYFDEEGIIYENSTIEGILQHAVEKKLISHLKNDLGIKSNKLTIESGVKRFFILYNWVCYNFYKRERYVKSGFKRWKTVWRERAIKKYEKIREKRN